MLFWNLPVKATARLVALAEDELNDFNPTPENLKRLRDKLGAAVSLEELREARADIQTELADEDGFAAIVERQGQGLALAAWAIAALGLLAGSAFQEPNDFLLTLVGVVAALGLQKWRWRIRAKRLLLAILGQGEEASGKE